MSVHPKKYAEESNSDSRRVIKNTFALYARMLVTTSLHLLISRYALKALGVEDYGIYNVVGGIIVILSFLNNSMAGATQRFLNVAIGSKNKIESKKIICNARIIHFVFAIICFLLFETVGLWFLNTHIVLPEGRIYAANCVFQFSTLSVFFSIITVPYSACVIAHEKMSAFAWIAIIDVSITLIVVISLLFISVDRLITYSILLFIKTNSIRIIYIKYCKKHFDECNITSLIIDRSLIKSMLSFSSWTIVGSLGYLGHTQGISIITNLFFGVTVNAALAITNQVNGLIRHFISNFLTAFNPQVVKTFAAQEMEEMYKLIIRGSKISLILASMFIIPFLLEIPTILDIWLTTVPKYTITFVRIVLLLTFFDSYTSILSSAQGATGKIKTYQIILTSIGLTHLPLTWICFELGYEPYSSQIIYLLLIIILQIVRTWFVCKTIHLSLSLFYREVIIRCYLSIGIAFVLPYIIHYSLAESIFRTFLVSLTFCILLIITTLYIALNYQEKNAIIQLVRKKMKKK